MANCTSSEMTDTRITWINGMTSLSFKYLIVMALVCFKIVSLLGDGC